MDYKSLLPNNLPENLLDAAHSLKDVGSSELAWEWREAIKVVEFLCEKNYAILGGDVLEFTSNGLNYTYDNWHTNKDKTMSWQEYVAKTKKKSISYIKKYHDMKGNNFCYTIVFQKK